MESKGRKVPRSLPQEGCCSCFGADLASYLPAQEQLGPAELTRFKDMLSDRLSPPTVPGGASARERALLCSRAGVLNAIS